ncbi:MAG TPA: methyltransferase domain-containing protein [Pirellulales bacterium]|nr:methyltransferase domain-containing protein [Pirellulales bacterium]
MWNPNEYLKFVGERSRPFFDLLAQVDRTEPRFIVDLGCGPGTLTATLVDRWPNAHVLGIDNSAEMLEQAQARAISGRLQFERGDIAAWSPPRPVDLLVSNAAFQWVDDHERLFKRLAEMLAADGTLAVQIPSQFDGPCYAAIARTAGDPRWAQRLAGVGLHRDSVMPPWWYVDRLHDLGLNVNAWETTYIHVLTGDTPILDWMRGTALRPLLARLDSAEIPEFERQLAERFRGAYPPRQGVTLFPFPRLFLVAERKR